MLQVNQSYTADMDDQVSIICDLYKLLADRVLYVPLI